MTSVHSPQGAPRKPVRGGAIIHRMAQAILEIGHGCTEHDLIRLGFCRRDITLYGERATERAAEMYSIRH